MVDTILAVGTDAVSWARAVQGPARRVVECPDPAVLLERDPQRHPAPGTDFDLILVHGVCGRLDATTNDHLVARLGALAAPGATIVIADAHDHDGAPTWTLASYARWLTDAGFTGVGLEPLQVPAGALVHARADRPHLGGSDAA